MNSKLQNFKWWSKAVYFRKHWANANSKSIQVYRAMFALIKQKKICLKNSGVARTSRRCVKKENARWSRVRRQYRRSKKSHLRNTRRSWRSMKKTIRAHKGKLAGKNMKQWKRSTYKQNLRSISKYFRSSKLVGKAHHKLRLLKCSRVSIRRNRMRTRRSIYLRKAMRNLKNWFKSQMRALSPRICTKTLLNVTTKFNRIMSEKQNHFAVLLKNASKPAKFTGKDGKAKQLAAKKAAELRRVRIRFSKQIKRAQSSNYKSVNTSNNKRRQAAFKAWKLKFIAKHSPVAEAAKIARAAKSRVVTISKEYRTKIRGNNANKAAQIAKLRKQLSKSLKNHSERSTTEKKTHLTKHQAAAAKQIALNNIKVVNMMKEMRKKGKTPTSIRKRFNAIAKRNRAATNKIFASRISEAIAALRKLEKIWNALLKKLNALKRTVSVSSTKNVVKTVKQKKCLNKITGFSRTVQKFKCVKSDAPGKEVCVENKIINNKVKCVNVITVYPAETCKKFEVNAAKNGTVCSQKVKVWPQGKCTGHIKHQKKTYCKNISYLIPRFFCKKYTILKSNRFCVENVAFFGKKFHKFVCKKTGKVVNVKLNKNGTSVEGEKVPIRMIKKIPAFVMAKSSKKPAAKKTKACKTCVEYTDIVSSSISKLETLGGDEEFSMTDMGRILVNRETVYSTLKKNYSKFGRRDQLVIMNCGVKSE